MRLILIVLSSILFFARLNAQDFRNYELNEEQKQALDTLSSKALMVKETGIPNSSQTKNIGRTQFQQLLNQGLTGVLNANSNDLGSYASLDTEESEIKLGMTLLPGKDESKGKNAVSISLSGSNSDNVLPIYSGNDFAKKVGAEIEFHHRLNRYGKQHINYRLSSLQAQHKQEKDINRAYDIGLRKWLLGITKKEMVADTLKLYDDIKPIQNKIKENRVSVSKITEQLRIEKDPQKIDSLKNELKKKNLEIDNAILDIQSIGLKIEEKRDSIANYSRISELRLLLNRRAEELQKVRSELSITGFRIMWVSFGMGFSNNTFKLFDSSLPLAEQISDASFISRSISLSISEYWSKDRAMYWSLGMAYSISDNFSELNKTTLKSRTNFDPNDPDARYTESEQKAFSGSYDRNISLFEIQGDLYYFLTRENSIAFHTFPRYLVIENRDFIVNLGVGFFTSLPKKDDRSSLINAELFYDMEDLFNRRNEEGDIFKRGQLGVKVTFPIRF